MHGSSGFSEKFLVIIRDLIVGFHASRSWGTRYKSTGREIDNAGP